ncbi:GAG-pre-integrase domain [Popillia japonica]|uniref:GAG-pre-integrase domain n=1 Tax=Popillia japonica TaxID=7064 RepID=A0AAW1HUN4_POPJA
MEMLINDVWQPGHLTNVWYVPNSKQNLFSAGAALDKGLLEYSNHKVCEFKRKDNTVVAVGVRQVSGTYKLLARVVMPDRICLAVESNNLQAWHEKLAHQNKRHIHKFLKQKSISFLNSIDVDFDDSKCEACVYGKMHRLSFHSRKNRSMCIWENASTKFSFEEESPQPMWCTNQCGCLWPYASELYWRFKILCFI